MKFASLAAGLALFLPAGVASAQSFTMIDTTTVDGSDSAAYTYPNNYIGSIFQTISLTVSQTGSTATLNYITAFSGSASEGGYSVGYADVFFGGIWAGTALSLGYQTNTGNNGVAAGAYQLNGYETSYNIWQSRVVSNPSITYGTGYGPNDTPVATVITKGSFIQSMPMSLLDTQITSGPYAGFYDLSITLKDVSINMVKDFENGTLTALWGTADCANGAFVAVSEPASLGVFAVGALALSVMLRRRRSLPA